MISGVKPRASGRNNVGQQLLAFLLFRDRWSLGQQCWRRLHSSSSIVGAMHATMLLPNSSLQSRISCILPTTHCRSQHCWESLRLFVQHCQHGRNNSQQCWELLPPFSRSTRVLKKIWTLTKTERKFLEICSKESTKKEICVPYFVRIGNYISEIQKILTFK